MATYAQSLHHIVFATKHRKPAIVTAHRRELFGYMHGIVKGTTSHLYRLNGVDDHVHLLVALHPDLALAGFVKTLKVGSSNWMRGGGLFPEFDHWQEGYGAFTVSWSDKDAVIEYIRGQDEHHRGVDFLDELRRLVTESGLDWDERYLP